MSWTSIPAAVEAIFDERKKRDERFEEAVKELHSAWEKADADASDPVNHPDHYKVGGIETIDVIEAKLSPEEFAGFCRGNMLKYIARAGHKDDAGQDMRKALWYGERWLRARNTRS